MTDSTSPEFAVISIAEELKPELHKGLRAALERAVKKGLTHDQFGGSVRNALREFSRAHSLKQIEHNIDDVVDGEPRLTPALREIEYSLATGGLLTETPKLLALIDRAIGIDWKAPPRAAAASHNYDPKMRYRVGDTVTHVKFGAGTVTRSEGKRVTIRFGEEARVLLQAEH